MVSAKKLPKIRRIGAADACRYRALLIDALIVHPDCSAGDYHCEITRPLSEGETELE